MGKKKKQERREAAVNWLKYRWEFMRRNPEYREAYQEALKLRESSEFTPEDIGFQEGNFVQYTYLETPEGKQEQELAETTGAHSRCMIDPDKSFDDVMDGPDSMEKACFLPGTFWEIFSGWSQDGSRVSIEIDLAKINSVDALKYEIGDLIDILYKDIYEKYLKKQYEPETAKRRRLIDYDIVRRILRVGEMREKQGLTFPQIAQEILPDNVNGKSAESQVEKDYKKFTYLVNGGYKELTYP